MSQVYTFDRSKNVTLNALKRIITGANGLSPREEWVMNAELILEPVGWDALWKLSKDMCKKYDVRYPCVVYVSVEGVDFATLSAELSVMGVQHEAIELPDAVSGIPLIQLWPTMRQPNTAIDVERTAEFIDLMRFFYTYVWMPWDELDERPLCGGTLEARVSLYAAARDKRVPCRAARAIAALRSDAADTLVRIREAEGELNRCADISDDDSLISPMTVSTLADLHAQLERLRARWTVFESPALRDAYIASMGSKWGGQAENITTLVWNGGPLHELQVLHEAAKLLPASSTVRVSGSLQEALAADAERLMLVGGSHELGGGPLPPLWVMGVGDVTLVSADPSSSLLNITEGATIANLRLSSHQVSTILLVQHQPVTIKDCQLVEDSSSEKEPSGYIQGCVVFAGGSLRMENCKMKRFYTGIVVHKGASVELVGCDISWCGVGVQVYAGAELRLVRCRLTHCTEHALRYEAASAAQHTMEGVTIQDCSIGDGDTEHDFTIVKQDLAILPHADGYEDLCIPN